MAKNGEQNVPPASKDQSNEKEYVQTYGKNETDDYGYYFYPSRTPGKVSDMNEASLFTQLKSKDFWRFDYKPRDNLRCKNMVYHCVDNNLKVRMMLRALKRHGCPVDVQRHIQCEPCKMKVSGGFDFLSNQVVVCQNNIKTKVACCNVLAHEMLHAFDSCRAKFDINNIEHVACTEIRAANMFHCSLMSAVVNGEAKLWNFNDRHMNCVKRKAMTSVMLVRNVSEQEANDVVDKVFNKCYNDLEPFGRRIKSWARDEEKSLAEGVLYGYTEE